MPSPMREMSAWLTREQLNTLTRQATRLGRRAWLQTLILLRHGGAWLSLWSNKAREEFAARSPVVAAKAATLLGSSQKTLSNGYAWCRIKTEELAPTLQARIEGAANALSSAARTKNTRLGQMLIIAGALLLICGGLLLGSGLILRAGTPTAISASGGSSEPIAWLFETPEAPLTHRIVFTLSGSPADLRINGLSIRGENTLDAPLTDVEAVVKPDGQRSDLNLALSPGRSTPQVLDPSVVEIEVTASTTPVSADIPAGAQFELAYALPARAGENGLTVEEFFETYGGLTLNVRYGLQGKRRTFIQYLSPETLKAQLAEIQAAGT
jgi:hypothetical protein